MAPPHSKASPSAPDRVLERRVVVIVAAIQFVNILDFMMVMPLGPDFALDLGIPTSLIGVIGGSYTLAAAVAGAAGSVWLDRFNRKHALLVALCGLVAGTLIGGLSTGLPSLLASRVVAGAFGGPATALAIAMVTDVVPVERRGRALGTVMASFSLASILGVPAGLEIAEVGGWRLAFFSVAGLGALVTAVTGALLPASDSAPAQESEALSTSSPAPSAPRRLFDGVALQSLAATLLLTIGVFAVVPNISAYLQYNLGYPRDELGLLYLLGGLCSFATLRVAGHFVDRWGIARVLVIGTLLHTLALWIGFIRPPLGISVLLIFCSYMVSGSVRMVPMQSLATRVPQSHQRGRFLSAQSALRHAGSALGSLTGALILVSDPSGRLEHVPLVAGGALLVAWLVVPLALRVESAVRGRERDERERSSQREPEAARPGPFAT